MHIAAAGRRDGGAFVQDRLPYAGGELVRHTADRTLKEITQPEVLAHIGPRPSAHIDQRTTSAERTR
ncbi:hypothetical protein [Streptomyces sp. NPDC004270]